jgi:hypothetical protein
VVEVEEREIMTETHEPLTLDRVMPVLREVVAERPDFVYEEPDGGTTCYYVWEDCPSCLVGHVLHRLGVPLEVMAERNTAQVHARGFAAAVGLTWLATRALKHAQDQQDAGEPWSAALDAAERVADNPEVYA